MSGSSRGNCQVLLSSWHLYGPYLSIFIVSPRTIWHFIGLSKSSCTYDTLAVYPLGACMVGYIFSCIVWLYEDVNFLYVDYLFVFMILIFTPAVPLYVQFRTSNFLRGTCI